ncbi:MAG: hypothetical protein QME60_03660 [Verrucomicrobiota bacterium]|nr:hypothetical protein [Verrucomicrobiota bacterium]
MTEPARWRRMWRRLGLRVLPALAMFLLFTWPLPRFLFTGIPSSAQSTEKYDWRRMIPGDHLQFLYQVWLAGDMIKGRTPLFLNPYEFNTGRDEERHEAHSYFLPAPLFYLVGEAIGGRAFGWNLMLFAHALMTYLFTALLLRRYAAEPRASWLFALPALALPCLWINLCGGSPTGIGMAFVPLVFLGLDMAVREDRVKGGMLAGIGLVMTYSTDAHTVFFSALAAPAWCLLAFVARERFEWRRPKAWGRLALAMLPAMVALAVVFAMSRSIQANIENSQVLEGSRSVEEVKKFTPTLAGLLRWHGRGKDAHIFLGWTAAIGLALGWLAALPRAGRDFRNRWRRFVMLSVLLAGMAGIVTLALGPYGPLDGLAFRVARKLIPHYGMIRQPAKAYCLMPTLLAVATLLAAGPLLDSTRFRRAGARLAAAAVALAVVECRAQVRACVALLDREQGAYAAVAEDAARRGQAPRALAVALWPGDSHWSSLNEYYGLLHRVRMVNGYRALVPRKYIDEIFRRFESVNVGDLADEQADELLGRGVGCVMLHEDAFPEKVSPYPVGFTLQRLLNHPRLALLKQAGPVWAFRILDRAEARPEQTAGWTAVFPARSWECEGGRMPNSLPILRDPSASGGGFVRLDRESPNAATTRLTGATDAPKQRWMIRLRGRGTAACEEEINGIISRRTDMEVESEAWIWREWPLPGLAQFSTVKLRVKGKSGIVDADLIILGAGEWRSLEVGESLELPAPCFFHAGQTDLEKDAVMFSAERDPADAIFYGPNLPLAPGRYRVELIFASPAANGTRLGRLTVRAGTDQAGPFDVSAGASCAGEFDARANLPARLDFRYSRRGDVAIRGVVIARLR